MRTPVLVTVLTLSAVRPAVSQVPGAEPPLAGVLRKRPGIEVTPAVAALRCCASERRLDLAVWWRGEAPGDGLRLGLVGGVVSAPGGTFSRSGVTLGVAHPLLGLELTGGMGVGIGRGEGARRMFSVAVGAGLPSVELDVTTTWFQEPPADSSVTGFPSTSSGFRDRQFTQAELKLRHTLGPVGLEATGGTLFGGEPDWVPQWLWGEIEVPVLRRLSVVASGGRRPDRRDLGQRGGGFAQLSLRWSVGSGEPEPSASPEDAEADAVTVTRLGAGRYRIRMRIPGARTVELTGDLTDWEILSMRRAGGRSDAWEAVLEKPAGVYNVNIRVDGGEWRVPPGLVPVPDRFGGSMGLLTLPGEEE